MKLTGVHVPNDANPAWLNALLELARPAIVAAMRKVTSEQLDAVIVIFKDGTCGVAGVTLALRETLLARAKMINMSEAERRALETPAPAGQFHCIISAPPEPAMCGLLEGVLMAPGGDA